MATQQNNSTPGGFWPEVWETITDSQIDDVLDLEVDIAREENRLLGIRWAIKIALYNGFLNGIDHVREIMGDIGSRPPSIVEKREEFLRPGFRLSIAGSRVKTNRMCKKGASGSTKNRRD